MGILKQISDLDTLMLLSENTDLKEYTTLKLGGKAQYFIETNSISELLNLLQFVDNNKHDLLIIGEGSNIILSSNKIRGVVCKLKFKEIKIIRSLTHEIYIKVEAGRNWDEFVGYCVENRIWGTENMSLIPGTVGALPVQNVGAYGQEAKNIIHEVEVIDRKQNNEICTLSNQECNFRWRSSIFNNKHKSRYIILNVTFKLSKTPNPILSRTELVQEISKLNTTNKKEISLELIRSAVINLRTNGKKLPIGKKQFNTGTFFRASIVKNQDLYKIIFKTFLSYGLKTSLTILGYKAKYSLGDSFKLPSSILLSKVVQLKSENANFELFQSNPAVLIHNGNGSSEELEAFIDTIQTKIFIKTGIEIPVEPERINLNF